MNQLTAEWTASMTIRDSSKWNSMLHIYLEWNSICWSELEQQIFVLLQTA